MLPPMRWPTSAPVSLPMKLLREAPISMRQLSIVKREFARVLGGMYHARVEYPKAPVRSEPATV